MILTCHFEVILLWNSVLHICAPDSSSFSFLSCIPTVGPFPGAPTKVGLLRARVPGEQQGPPRLWRPQPSTTYVYGCQVKGVLCEVMSILLGWTQLSVLSPSCLRRRYIWWRVPTWRKDAPGFLRDWILLILVMHYFVVLLKILQSNESPHKAKRQNVISLRYGDFKGVGWQCKIVVCSSFTSSSPCLFRSRVPKKLSLSHVHQI